MKSDVQTQTHLISEKMAKKEPARTGNTLDFLANLPTFNPQNFSRYRVPSRERSTSLSQLDVYVDTKEEAEKPQRIVNDHKNALLRQVHKEWEKTKLKLGASQHEKAGSSRKRRGDAGEVSSRKRKAMKMNLCRKELHH